MYVSHIWILPQFCITLCSISVSFSHVNHNLLVNQTAATWIFQHSPACSDLVFHSHLTLAPIHDSWVLRQLLSCFSLLCAVVVSPVFLQPNPMITCVDTNIRDPRVNSPIQLLALWFGVSHLSSLGLHKVGVNPDLKINYLKGIVQW